VVEPQAVQIIPGLPDRNSGKIYRLQVGAYSVLDTADRTARNVRAAGFNVELEQVNTIYRVMVLGIASADVYQASVRLGSLGFSQIWVRE
jgi:cell division protein FtsN